MNIADLRFLVVEDQGFQRWVAGHILEGLGAKYIFSAADGKKALEILAGLDAPVDVVISDLDMPGMDGMEFIRHLGALGGAVSLIVLSGLERSLISTVETMARAYGVNLLGALEKPPSAKKLLKLIRLHNPSQRPVKRAKAATFSAHEIAAGLEKGQFEAFFQPKVEIKTRRVKGAEALARWRHPEHGIVPPGSFIETMELDGMMNELTEAVLKAGAINCGLWHDAGLDVSVAVNLSLGSLCDVSISDRMLRLVEAHGIAPRNVIFEVTELAAMSDIGKTLENLSRLRMKGFGLSIDDFGTGYSSMQRLSGVPFTELKIDQTFVKNASTQASSRAVLESSLEIARKLGIVAVAEGVESSIEWELVRALDCPLAQGFFIAPPMEASEFLDWARVRGQVCA